jgi:hypothetical protein
MNNEAFTGNKDNFSHVEQHADTVINDILKQANFEQPNTRPCSMCHVLINLFKEHIIWRIEYKEKKK